MPSLEEMRKFLQGEEVDGLPSHQKPKASKPKSEKITKGDAASADQEDSEALPKSGSHKGGQYTVDTGGKDALLKFGLFDGCNVSDLAADPRGRSYLGWMLDEDFPNDLKEIIRLQLEMEKL